MSATPEYFFFFPINRSKVSWLLFYEVYYFHFLNIATTDPTWKISMWINLYTNKVYNKLLLEMLKNSTQYWIKPLLKVCDCILHFWNAFFLWFKSAEKPIKKKEVVIDIKRMSLFLFLVKLSTKWLLSSQNLTHTQQFSLKIIIMMQFKWCYQ